MCGVGNWTRRFMRRPALVLLVVGAVRRAAECGARGLWCVLR